MTDIRRPWRDEPFVRWERIQPWVTRLSIVDVSPREGWPGTVIEIFGTDFDARRDENIVYIGGERALVIDASATRLIAMAGQETHSGEVLVEVGGTAVSGGDFTVLPWPDSQDPASRGAPRFFHGPQHGTPETNKKNQRVQVLYMWPTDHDPGTPAQRAALQNTLIGRFDQAADFWDQASYGSTTWDFEHSGWVAMPHARRHYFWEQADIDDARGHYLRHTRSIVRDGIHLVHGGVGAAGWLPVDHPSPLAWSFLLGSANPDGTTVLSLRRVGTTLYAGTHGGSLFVYDVSNTSTAVLRGQVNLANPVWDIDVSGTTVVAALGAGGVATVDVSNPTNPSVLTNGTASGSMWASVVRISGARVYSNRGHELHVHTLGAFGALTFVANLALGNWITDIDITGTTMAVATDGGGLVMVEATAGGVLQRGASTAAVNLRGVRIAGTRVYAAALEDGVVAYDVSNLATPTRLGVRKLRKPVYAIDVNGAEVVAAVGSTVLVSIDFADPANPRLNGTEMDAAWEPDLPGARTALHEASDGQALVKDYNRLYIDALRAWFATGGTMAHLNGFEGVVVIVHGPFLRGQSFQAQAFDAGAGVKERFNAAKGVFYVASDASWDRLAHEIVHWLGIGDIYEQAFANGTVLRGSAGAWCMSGEHGLAPAFCAHRTTDQLKWWSVGTGASGNVKQLVWSPTAEFNDTFEVVAHDSAKENTDNRWHALRLVAATGLTYWVEVRQRMPPGLLFDQSIPVPAGDSGRVIVMRATEETSPLDNTFERPVQLMGALDIGGKVVDAVRNLVITVEAEVSANPLTYRVRVQWNTPIPENPDGAFDLTMLPWDTTTYETTDIWVDSPRNNLGTFEFHEPGNPTRPIRNGDRPWVGRANTINARIRNTGPLAASDVYVSCYITQPPGIGDNGQWQILDTQHVASIPGHGETIVQFPWRPAEAKHTCISVAILPQLGEVSGKNNRAQENVAIFDSVSSSSHAPVTLHAEVRSPFTIRKRIDLHVRHLPDRWHAVVDASYVWLDGKGAAPVNTIIWTDIETFGTEPGEGERLAMPTVEGWTQYLDQYRPIGGILAPVRAVPKVAIDFGTEAGGGAIYIWGELAPPAQDVPIVVELADEQGDITRLYCTSESNGRFHTSTPDIGLTLPPGRYSAQAFTSGGPNAAETESAIVVVELDI